MTASIRPIPQRSAFAAAFLSFLFPGLGHAYAGAWGRALAFAVAPLALLALVAGLYVHYGLLFFGLWVLQTSVLGPFFVLNIVILVYRAIATVDAYRIAQYANAYAAAGERAVGRPRLQAEPLSLAGLAAILLVMLAGHAWLGFWDLQAFNVARDTHSIPVIAAATPDPSVARTLPPRQTPPPAYSPTPWNGTDRLNILLVGVDQRPADRTFNTDTLIVVSIDPQTHKVAMFSLPRDTTGIPLPPNSGLSYLFGANYNAKINSLWSAADGHRDVFPGGGAQAIKQAIGYLYGLNVQYYVMVNFEGFRKVVDTFGGVTVNVETPVVDDLYPGDYGHLRLYIPPGIQHMNGAQALQYARSRHGSNDFDRAQRQQRILTAIEQEADLDAISDHLADLISELGQTVHTDIPEGPDILGPLIEQARAVRSSAIRSYVFDPPVFAVEDNNPQLYQLFPKVPQIRAAVQAALSGKGPDPAQLQAAALEQAPIEVQNGSGVSGQATAVADYLTGLGLNAQASSTQPAKLGGPTRILVVNGADTKYKGTMAAIDSIMGVSGPPSTDPNAVVQAVSDPSRPPGFIIVTGNNTPDLASPSG